MSTVGTLQAETMKSTVGYGASVVSDATASGGKALLVDSDVTVLATLTLTAPAAKLTVSARTDATAANMIVTVDGKPFASTNVERQTWVNHTYTRVLLVGAHTVTIRFTNPESRNLYLDSITFETAVAPPPSTGTRLTAYLTGYGYPDNDPAFSDAIAHPTATRPHAGGTGTYADPISMAVGFTGSGTPDLPYGTIFYVPALRRYFRIDDLCGACHGSPRPPGTSIWLDCWVGGKGKTAAYVDAIASSLTGAHTVVKNPPSNYAVVPGELADGRATSVTLYGETPVLA